MLSNKTRILYLGTPEISAHVLRGLILAGYNVIGVVAQPDKPIGRGKKIEFVPTKVVAEEFGIPVFQPLKIRLDYEFAKDLHPDLILCFAYGQIIPQQLLDIPPLGSINLHGSLLPKYRGAAPMQYALINGEKETGITLMQMVDKMDAGGMFGKIVVPISLEDNYTSLSQKMASAALKLALDKLPLYIDGQLVKEEQNEALVTYAGLIKKEQEHLDLTLPKAKIIGWIRALSIEPGAYLYRDNNQMVKIFEAEDYSETIEALPGTVVSASKNGIVLQLIDGQINLLKLQKPGKKIVGFRDFVNGEPQFKGTVLK